MIKCKRSILFLLLIINIFLLSCTLQEVTKPGRILTKEDLQNIAKLMQENYNKINTLNFHEKIIIESEAAEEKIVTFEHDIFIKKPSKYRIDTTSQCTNEKFRIITSNYAYFRDCEDKVVQFPCSRNNNPTEINFVVLLESLNSKYDLQFKSEDTINGRKAYLYDFIYASTADVKGKDIIGGFAGSLWIDQETLMPLKETSGPGTTTSTVEYSNYGIDKEVPDGLFVSESGIVSCK